MLKNYLIISLIGKEKTQARFRNLEEEAADGLHSLNILSRILK